MNPICTDTNSPRDQSHLCCLGCTAMESCGKVEIQTCIPSLREHHIQPWWLKISLYTLICHLVAYN